MDKGCDAAFGYYVGVDARPTAEAVNAEVEQGHCGLCCGRRVASSAYHMLATVSTDVMG